MVIKKGEENDLLVSVSHTSPDKVAIALNKTVALKITGKNAGTAAIGSKAQVTVGGKTYDGTCISNAWNGKSYAFTEEDKAKVATVSMDERANGTIIVAIDQADFDGLEDHKDCRADVNTLTLQDAIVLPGRLVYSEETKSGTAERSFVWKIIDGTPIKQYVIRGTDFGIGNGQNTVILSGLSEGDILADEQRQM